MSESEKKYWPWLYDVEYVKPQFRVEPKHRIPVPQIASVLKKPIVVDAESYRIRSARRKILSHKETELRLKQLPPEVEQSIREKLVKARLIRLYLHDNMICQLCFQYVELSDVSQDHVIPRRYLGSNALENMQLTHYLCNRECCSFERMKSEACTHERYKIKHNEPIQFGNPTTNPELLCALAA